METIQEKAQAYFDNLPAETKAETTPTVILEAFEAGADIGAAQERFHEEASEAKYAKREDQSYREACAVAVLASMLINADRSQPHELAAKAYAYGDAMVAERAKWRK